MKLRYSATSPYVRKVMVVAHEHGLVPRIAQLATKVWDPGTDIAKDNPLGKVPALVLDDGTALYDSPVICEYLDALGSGAKLFPQGNARFAALRQQALGDGVLDAAILRRLELQRPAERQEGAMLERYAQVMVRGMTAFEAEVASFGAAFTIGQIAAAVACGYLDFRFAHEDWRPGRPKLAAWYEGIATRPSIAATAPRE